MGDSIRGSSPADVKKGSPRTTTYCCVPQCSTYAGDNISFHYFPKDVFDKAKWESALRMGKSASKSMRVCSKHFSDTDYIQKGAERKYLKKGAVPSHNLPKRLHDKVETSPQKKQKEARKYRATSRPGRQSISRVEVDSNDPQDVADGVHVDEQTFVTVVTCEMATQANLIDNRTTVFSDESGLSLADILCDKNSKATQVNFPFPHGCQEAGHSKAGITLVELLDTDEKLFTFTGIHSLDLLAGLVDCAADLEAESRTKKMILPLKDRILITMTKLKLNLGFTAMGVLYGISRQTVSNYFKHMIPVLGAVLKCLIPWPDHEIVRSNLPLSFKKYRNTRIILDCAEVPLEKSKCLKCRILSYSQYKKNFTVKFNVGVTPSGLITEISLPYGGRASDKFIVNDSGILDKLDFHDAVMVDKGYSIEKECMERCLFLYRPPFLSKKQQMDKESSLENASIARARVHVERVIQRLREFKFLKHTVPWHLVGYLENILDIAAGMTNLGPPIIAIHRFM